MKFSMKASMLLLETLLSFLIMSVIFLFSTFFYAQILKTNNETFDLALIQSDLFATKLFIGKQLQHGKTIEVTSNSIRFYAFDIHAFLQNYYSGFIDLSKSSSAKAFSPNSNLLKLESTSILFNDSELHELNKSLENNILLFKNSSPKRVFQRYNIVKNISTIHFNNSSLYFNGNLLQNNISEFHASLINERLHINICIENICKEWVF
ncbi:MAG: hypothetical protein WC141_05265 [Arcobacteraceae bacterium]